jgi:hypothetical protein
MDLNSPRNTSEAVAECVRMALIKRANAFDGAERAKLERFRWAMTRLWGFMAEMTAWDHRDRIEVEPSSGSPGYLALRLNDSNTLQVPFFLATGLPHADVLRELADVASRVKIGRESIICLSGSVCQMGLGLDVGDIDFCEYIPTADRGIWQRLVHVVSAESESLLCYKLRLSPGGQWVRPWANDFPGRGRSTPGSKGYARFVAARRRKCAFITTLPAIGALDVTNVLLVVDYASREPVEGRLSFAEQEVPISKHDWTPRDLCSPLELGAYALWVLAEAESLCRKARRNPRIAVKAARRALSAARLILDGRASDEILDLLKEGARLAALYDRCKLHARIKRMDRHAQRRLSQVKAAIDTLRRAPTGAGSYDALSRREREQLAAFAKQALPVVEDAVSRMRNRLGARTDVPR